MHVQWFILRKTIVFLGLKEVPSFSKGVELFSGGGGGGGGLDDNFYRNLLNL